MVLLRLALPGDHDDYPPVPCSRLVVILTTAFIGVQEAMRLWVAGLSSPVLSAGARLAGCSKVTQVRGYRSLRVPLTALLNVGGDGVGTLLDRNTGTGMNLRSADV